MEPTPPQQPPTPPQIPTQTPQQPPAWHQLNYGPPPVRATRPVQPLTVNGKALTSGWIVGLTLVALMVLCGCFGSGYAMGLTATAATPTTSTTNAGVVNQPTQQAQPTTPVTPIPTTPKLTPTPSNVVLAVSGNGSKTTAAFTVHGTWEVSWTCNNGGDGAMTTLGFAIYDASTNDFAANADGADYSCPDGRGGSDSSIYHGGGTFYLSITADVNYTITVTDLPN